MAIVQHTTGSIVFACLYCGAMNTRHRSEIHNPAMTFCNKKCWGAYRSAERQVQSLEEEMWLRFWDKVVFPDGPHGCWLWAGARSGNPGNQYGNWVFQGKIRRAHCISSLFFYGPYNLSLDICHHCDTPLCVKPQHLFAGTTQANMDDMWSKGRQGRRDGLHGEENPNAKLTATQVGTIQALCDEGLLTQKEIGRQFGISREHVRDIGRRKRWKHLSLAS